MTHDFLYGIGVIFTSLSVGAVLILALTEAARRFIPYLIRVCHEINEAWKKEPEREFTYRDR